MEKDKDIIDIGFCFNCSHYSFEKKYCYYRSVEHKPKDSRCIYFNEMSNKTIEEIEDTINLLEKNPTKRRKRDEDEFEYINKLITKDFIYEQCYDENTNHLYFIEWDKEKQTFKVVDEFEYGGINYRPINGDELRIKAVILPTLPIDYGTEDELDKEIVDHIHKWLDVSEDYEKFALYNIKLSWVYEKFNTLNYTRAIGDTGTGKSRFLFTLGHLHYKPMVVAGSLTPAVIFRIINKWKGTLLIDEGDQESSDETNAFIKIMNCGYEKGMPVSRCDKNDPNKIDFFDVFCPKVLTTRKRFDDKATEARCMTTIMSQTFRLDVPDVLNENYYKSSELLRNKLLMWRFRNYDRINPSAGEKVDLSKYEPRLRQVNRAFVSLFAENKEKLAKFIKHLDKYQRNIIEERAESFEGIIINAIAEMIGNGWEDITPTDIVNFLNEKGETFKYTLTARGIGKTVKGLGLEFKRRRVNDQIKNCLVFDDKMLENIFSRYVIDEDIVFKLKSVGKMLRVTFVTSSKETAGFLKNENLKKAGCQRIQRNKRNNVTQQNTDIEEISVLEWDERSIHHVKCNLCNETECNEGSDGKNYCKKHLQ